MKHALVFVSIAVGGGLAALLALRPFAPSAGPVVGAALVAVALIGRSIFPREGGGPRVARRSSAPVA